MRCIEQSADEIQMIQKGKRDRKSIQKQRIKVKDTMETDSEIVSESWQNTADPAINFLTVDR